MSPMVTKNALLVVEPAIRIYKEPIVKSLRQYYPGPIVFASGLHRRLEETWVAPYADGFFPFSYRGDDLIEKTKAFARENGFRFEGALTYVESSVHHVNRLQHALGLPVVSRQNTKTIRSKRQMREHLFQNGFTAQPHFRVLRSMKEVEAFIDEKPLFPLVLKPSEMMASLGVRKIKNALELRQAFPEVSLADFWDEDLRGLYGDISTDVLSEELIEGPEYSIETVVFRGTPTVLGVTEKQSPPHTFDELSHTFPAPSLANDVSKKIEALIYESHKLLELENTFTHTEVKVRNGEPILIEINCRLGGDLISELVQSSLNCDAGAILVDIHCDKNPSLPTSPAKNAHSIYYISTAREGRVVNVPEVPKMSSSTIEFKHHVKKDDLLYRNNLVGVSRLGHVISIYDPEGKPPFSESEYEIQAPLDILDIANDKIVTFLAREDDVDTIAQIELNSWSEEQAAPKELILKRIQTNPESTLLGFSLREQRPVGVITLLPIDDFNLDAMHRWDYYSERSIDPAYFASLTNPNCYYGITITAEDRAPRGTATAMVKMVSRLSHAKGKSLAYGIRVPSYAHYAAKGVPIEEYYDGLVHGRYHEDIYKVAKNAGGEPAGILKDFYEDPESRNYAIAIIHPNHECHQIKK